MLPLKSNRKNKFTMRIRVPWILIENPSRRCSPSTSSTKCVSSKSCRTKVCYNNSTLMNNIEDIICHILKTQPTSTIYELQLSICIILNMMNWHMSRRKHFIRRLQGNTMFNSKDLTIHMQSIHNSVLLKVKRSSMTPIKAVPETARSLNSGTKTIKTKLVFLKLNNIVDRLINGVISIRPWQIMWSRTNRLWVIIRIKVHLVNFNWKHRKKCNFLN